MWWLFLAGSVVVFIILSNGISYMQQAKRAGVRLNSLFRLWGDNTYSVLLVIFILVFIAFGFLFPWFFYSFIHSLYMDIESQISSVTINSSAFRNVSLSIAGSVTLAIAALGLILTFIRNLLTRQQNRTDEQRLVTEQISRAVEQTGAYKHDTDGGKHEPNIEVRLGGLYSLQRIMKDSLKDENAIAKIFYAYVRENTKKSEIRIKTGIINIQLREDVQAALDIISQFHKEWRERRKEILDDLQRNFARSNFSGYSFLGMDFSNAILNDVDLSDAKLNDVDLFNAKLNYADLSRANLSGAKLSGANLSYADLTGTDLHGVDLSEVLNLTQDQVNKANGDENTVLPKVQVQGQEQELELPKDWTEPEANDIDDETWDAFEPDEEDGEDVF